jgi:hypothetical protein
MRDDEQSEQDKIRLPNHTLSTILRNWFEFHFLENIGWYAIAVAAVLLAMNHFGLLEMGDLSSELCPYGRSLDAC